MTASSRNRQLAYTSPRTAAWVTVVEATPAVMPTLDEPTFIDLGWRGGSYRPLVVGIWRTIVEPSGGRERPRQQLPANWQHAVALLGSAAGNVHGGTLYRRALSPLAWWAGIDSSCSRIKGGSSGTTRTTATPRS